MATPQTTGPAGGPSPNNDDLRSRAIHYTSWGCLIAGPLIIALPPRKLDLYTFGLLLCTFIGGNQVSREQTGISMIDRIGQRLASSIASLPPKALEIQRRAQDERLKLAIQAEKQNIDRHSATPTQQETGSSGLLRKVWMGSESENWKEERLQKEREALESGKGYADLIMEQVWEVWNGEKKKPEKSNMEQSNENQGVGEPRDQKKI
ncbi:hypothetical protein K3495_g7676 [Podosphaera aphanis]|nr:hypothetical protein K3495_g7676 [Podosphaera aphanis]